MTSLDRVTGITPDMAAFLGAVGVLSAEDLAAADVDQLYKAMVGLGQTRGRIADVPGWVTVKNWIQTARILLETRAPEEALEEIPEMIDIDDIPEAFIDTSAPDYYDKIKKETPPPPPPPPAPVPAPPPPAPVAAPAPAPPPPAPKPQPAPAAPVTAAPAALAAEPEGVRGLDKSRFQTLDAYAKAERGIQPLKRSSSPVTDSGDKVVLNSDGKLSRLTRRGVLYPNAGGAIFGAIISILWRIALLASIIGMPIYLYYHSTPESRPVTETLLWLGGLFVLGLMQLFVISRVRCRICSCHFFFSRTCSKNSRAHRLPLIGYVASLSVHLLLFQWFRCMYCGTAIRLFGGRAKAKAVVVEADRE